MTDVILRRFGIEPGALFDLVVVHIRDAQEARVFEGAPFDQVFASAFMSGFLHGWAIRGEQRA